MIPGLGTFTALDNTKYSKELQIPDSNINAPNIPIQFEKKFNYPNPGILEFISEELELNEAESRKDFYNFSYFIQNELDQNGVFHFDSIGVLKKYDGQLLLTQNNKIEIQEVSQSENSKLPDNEEKILNKIPSDFIINYREELSADFDLLGILNNTHFIHNTPKEAIVIDEISKIKRYSTENKIYVFSLLILVFIYILFFIVLNQYWQLPNFSLDFF
jgi:hypothetical protein